MARRRRGRRARQLRTGAWFLGSAGVLVVGLVIGAHLFDDEGLEPARSLDEPTAAEPPTARDRVRVEVLNGGGVRGMAALARDHLRERGFDVVYYGNASSFDHEITVVLARTGSNDTARGVAGVLGVDSVAAAPDTTRFVDVTVLLGSDWSEEALQAAQDVEQEPEDDPEDGAWWDLRRYLGGAGGTSG